MSIHHWQLLEEVQASLKQPSDLPGGILYAIAERLDEAISAPSRAPLEALEPQLAGLFAHLLKIAPEAAINAVRLAASSGEAEQAAYTLGQISFAQLLAAQARERRVGDDFEQLLRDSRYKTYVDALAIKDYTGVELAEICGERVETVSRKLKQLRELGITEFRREGTSYYNFLTPAARSLMPENEAGLNAVDEAASNQSNMRIRKIEQLNSQTSPHMRQNPSFSDKAA